MNSEIQLLKNLRRASNSKSWRSFFYEIEKNALIRESYWNEENYLSHIISSDDRVFLLEEHKVIQAFVFYRLIDSEMEVTHWSIREKGKGKGTLFFREFLSQCGKGFSKIILECGEWNKPAEAIYKKFAFTKMAFSAKLLQNRRRCMGYGTCFECLILLLIDN